jgi:hypothetical protein
MADDNPGCAVFLAFLVFALIVAAAIMAIMLALSAGSLFGSGTALANYVRAFRKNVKPERVTI